MTTPDRLTATIAAWLSTPDWPTSQAFLTEHPDLCSDRAAQIFDRQIVVQPDPRARGTFELHRVLAGRARAEGIVAAYNWLARYGAACSEAGTAAGDAQRQGRINDAIDALGQLRGLIRPVTPTRWAVVVHDECRLLLVRYQLRGSLADLDRIIALHHEVLDVQPQRPDLRIGTLVNLAGTLLLRIDVRPELATVTEAVALLDEAREMLPPASPMNGAIDGQLCAAWTARFRLDDAPEHLDRAIGHGERAVAELGDPNDPRVVETQVTPADAASQAASLHVTLAHAYRERFERNRLVADLGRAITGYRLATALTPVGSPQRRDRLTNLGAALAARYRRTGVDADLAEAARLLAESLPADSGDTVGTPAAAEAAALINLAGAFWLRWERSGELDALDRAVAEYRRAAEAATPASAQRRGALNNLASTLAARASGYSGQPGDFPDALHYLRQARDAVGAEPVDRRIIAANFARATSIEADRTGDLASLGEAIELLEAVLAEDPEDSEAHGNLAVALLRRARLRGGDTVDTERAEEHFQRALDLTPAESPAIAGILLNAGLAMAERYQRTPHPDLPAVAGERLARAREIGLRVDVPVALSAAQVGGRWAELRNEPEEAAEAYDQGLEAADLLFRGQASRAHQEAWLRVVGDLAPRAARTRLTFPEPDVRGAVGTLERGRALLLTEALGASDRVLEDLTDVGFVELAQRYQNAADRLAALQADNGPRLTA